MEGTARFRGRCPAQTDAHCPGMRARAMMKMHAQASAVEPLGAEGAEEYGGANQPPSQVKPPELISLT